MATRASIIVWSAGSGLLLGLFVDALLIGLWVVAASAIPALSPRPVPRWMISASVVVLAAIPIAGSVLGYLEGRLKTI